MNRKLVFAAISGLMLAMSGAVQAGGDAARGEALAPDCADCHGADGRGDDETPGVVGLEEAYFVEQMLAYKSGERVDESGLMEMYVEDLSEQDIADLAAYYATLPAE